MKFLIFFSAWFIFFEELFTSIMLETVSAPKMASLHKLLNSQASCRWGFDKLFAARELMCVYTDFVP